ncbi:MAG TPA: four helix bundle protein [Flavitalea sp.]|nr:four helix bundle protein [Flavitalea sp.]
MFSFENLTVYKKAFQTNQKVYHLLKSKQALAGYLRNQLGRASLSIMLNIAEGSAKFTRKDRKNFYVTARGSSFECAAIITFLHEEGEIETVLKDELNFSFEEISRILFTMIKNLD